MGYRLSKIYTRTGDKGDTGLGDGARVPKDDLRVSSYGTLDELNCAVGIVLSDAEVVDPIRAFLVEIQHKLFELGGELCIPGHMVLTATDTEQLEQWLDGLNASLPPLKEFILPGGTPAAAQSHLARAICRRAERLLVSLMRVDNSINPHSLAYLNRLSDLLFVISRAIVQQQGADEVLWRHERGKP